MKAQGIFQTGTSMRKKEGLKVTWDCLPDFLGKSKQGFCVFGSLDLIDNESSLRITARAAPGIDNR